MKLKKAKKGFTLVELVVVIAIIAILSTVSVVGYFGFTKKANVSGDKALVSQLNTILKAKETETGSKPETATEAIGYVEEQGINVAKLKPLTSKYLIAWNGEANEFALLNESKELVTGKLSSTANLNWLIASSYSVTENTGYSVYLMPDYKGDSTLNITTGLDVGENTNVEVVNYTNESSTAKRAVIRTNGGELTVNAPLDTVEHYEKADKVTITAVAGNSYHENGEITGNIEIANGRIVMEAGSQAAAIKVVAEADDITSGNAAISIDTKETTTSIVILDEVKAAIESKGGNNVISAGSNDIITDEDIFDNMNKFSGGLGTEKSPYLISNTKEFSLYGIEGYAKLIADIDATAKLTTVSENLTLDLNGHYIKAFNGIYGSKYAIAISGQLTVMDSVGTGMIYSESIYSQGKSNSGIIGIRGGTFILESGTIRAAVDDPVYGMSQYGIAFDKGVGGKIIVNGGKIETGWYSIVGNGQDKCKTEVIINGGEVISLADYAIYNAQGGTGENQSIVTVNGGVVLGYAGAISMQKGILNINGGTITSKGTGYTGDWGDGTGNDANSAISLTTEYDNVTVNYTAGTIEAQANAKLVNLPNKSYELTVNKKFYDIIKDLISVDLYNVTENNGTYTILKK